MLGMVDTFLASLMALFWSMIMLLVCMSIGALVLCESWQSLGQILDVSWQTPEGMVQSHKSHAECGGCFEIMIGLYLAQE